MKAGCSVQLDVISGSDILTHSSTRTYQTCPRKFFYAYELGIRPIHNVNPLRQGGAFHLGLELLKAGNAEQEAADAVLDAYADVECPPWMTPEEFAIEVETTVAMVRGWSRRWAGDWITNYVAVELAFNVPIVNPASGRETPSFTSSGKIDGIAELPDGRLALVEHKTTGDSIDSGSDYWRRLMMDAQLSRYVLAARKIGYDVQTTVYDVTRKPSISPKAVSKADRAQATSTGHYFGLQLTETCPERETAKMFAARLLADMATRPDFYFQRVEIPRLESDLAEFEAEQWTIQRSIRQSQLDERNFGAAAWPRNTGACLIPRCTYFDHCRQGQIDINNIPAGFKRVTVMHQELAADTSTEKSK